MKPNSLRLPVDPYLRAHQEGCSLAVRVQPGAKRTAITGVYSSATRPHLKIALQAPPVEGKANEALVAYLAKTFSIAQSRIKILHGERDRIKLLVLSGMKVSDAEAILQAKL